MLKIIQLLQYKEIKKPIDIKDRYIGNHKCHVNCLSYAKKHKNIVNIIGCLQVFNSEEAVAHFVVKDNKGQIIDPTYGNMATSEYSYVIPLEEYMIESFNPDRELENLKSYLYSLLPWYSKLITHRNDM